MFQDHAGEEVRAGGFCGVNGSEKAESPAGAEKSEVWHSRCGVVRVCWGGRRRVAVSRKLRMKVVSKRLALAAAPCVQLPCSSLRDGMEVGGGGVVEELSVECPPLFWVFGELF